MSAEPPEGSLAQVSQGPRILVIRLSSLGDVVLTGPVFRNLKAHWPGCRISVLVKPAFAGVLEGHPCVDEILRFRGLLPALREIRARSFTHCLDLHATFRSLLLRRLSGIPHPARYRKDALARRLFVWLGFRSPRLEKHTLDRYLEALALWGVPVTTRTLETRGPPEPGPLTGPSFSRILVIQTALLGDAALTFPLLQAVRRRFPGARLEVLVRPDHQSLFDGKADEAVPDDKRGSGGGLGGFWRLRRTLAERRYDLALVPHRSLRSALLAALARIPERVGFDASAGRFLFTRVVPFSWLMHDAERNLSLLSPFGPLPRVPESGAVRGTDSRRAGPSLAEKLRAAGRDPSRPLIGVHTGASIPTKRWLPERFAAVIRELTAADGLQAVLVGGPGEAQAAAEVRRASGTPHCLDLTGATSVPELLELMGELALFITNDSGPMHLAAAAGVPVLAVFGSTTRELGFFPYGEGHRVVETDLPCRPCGLHGRRSCPEGHFLCMRLLTSDQVVDEARRMLGRPSLAPLGAAK